MSRVQEKNGKKVKLNSFCGTVAYAAPEIFEKDHYSEKCDLWSIGVIGFYMMSGNLPFVGKNIRETTFKICSVNYDFSAPAWESVSEDSKNFVESLIELNEDDRLSPDQALEHTWLKSTEKEQHNYQIHPHIFENLMNQNKPHELHYQFLSILIQYLNDDDIDPIVETFKSIDMDNSGIISLDEITLAYQQLVDGNFVSKDFNF